ncbi:MAG TPA: SDR family NAD(P)-dependent oxidoreductase [Polyangia bacterium]|nr:SDR family NAD(P)-dependent oxidoreductase [Polyangia bacterium]
MSEGQPPQGMTDAEALQLAEKLEALTDDRARLAALDTEVRRRLLTAAGRLSRPRRDELRGLSRALRRKKRDAVTAADEAALEQTGIRQARRAPVFVTPRPPAALGRSSAEEAPPSAAPEGDGPRLREPRTCYVCKAHFVELHAFYDQMCPPCAAFNWSKRHQTADLRGRTALITGARVKIGYQASIMLLRAGARVLVTTRFPRDAARRYATEPDFADFAPRLQIFGLDLRHTPSVELFARQLAAREPRLDFILHNACQTVRRPPSFYAHLMEAERAPAAQLPAAEREILRDFHAIARDVAATGAQGLLRAPELSQVAHLAEERLDDRLLEDTRLTLFPAGQLDQDLQQVDRREINSWRLKLGDVPTVELLEVQLVNAVAPFVMTNALRPLMARDGRRDKHVVNVSAMEGQFYRAHKTDKHPHTNMAKAALNMLTRTSAADMVQDGIHMNSVDTGWVTDEDPMAIAARKVEEHGFSPPLDIVDGAARICDPIFAGLNSGEHAFGVFFKDYKPIPW